MVPALVEQTMNQLVHSLNTRTSNITAIYVYGSVALNDYIEGSSDIDFIAIVREPFSQTDVQAIIEAHKEVEAAIPNTDIMGAYILFKDLNRKQGDIKPLLTYFDKQIHIDGRGADLNPITWWIVKKHGIRVYGSEVTFNYDLDKDTLRTYVINNLNSYWVGWITRLEQKLQTVLEAQQELEVQQLDQAIEWCTLGMLRQLFTLKEQDITSKVGAGRYGLQHVPGKWHGIIEEAIAIKRLQPNRLYSSQMERLTDLIALLKFIQLEANRVYEIRL
ncbi:nucleotidyltransferase domain-containing protein [Paenibacillus sp. P36]|uniref:nucleotidyltransferase domain-containing protein n=1 Tax=Paenibacillus sp. P36 TaxID=3342538 RepID=UPI0038B28B06